MEAQPDLTESELKELELFIFFGDDRNDVEDEEEICEGAS